MDRTGSYGIAPRSDAPLRSSQFGESVGGQGACVFELQKRPPETYQTMDSIHTSVAPDWFVVVLGRPRGSKAKSRFKVGNTVTDYLAVGDSEWSVLEDIVDTTRVHGNDDRLRWDIYNIPHHCSYLALSDTKGEKETEPKPKVKELLLEGQRNAYLVSSSFPIEDTEDGWNQSQPPHIQAKKCYENYLRQVGGARFLVTMEEPNKKKPEPLVFIIDSGGVRREGTNVSGASIITSSPTPRAGRR